MLLENTNDMRSIKELLMKGADRNLTDDKDNRPIDLAQKIITNPMLKDELSVILVRNKINEINYSQNLRNIVMGLPLYFVLNSLLLNKIEIRLREISILDLCMGRSLLCFYLYYHVRLLI